MFLHVSVILFTGGCGRQTPPWADTQLAGRHPSLWLAGTPSGRQTIPQAGRQFPRQADTPLWQADTPVWQADTPSGRQTPLQQVATAVDGTHPTGMQSCL